MDVHAASSQEDVVFVDVREDDEWDAGHIDGAAHIPMDQIAARADDFASDVRYVAVCRSGARSAQVAGFLSGQGVNIDNLDGGMQAWQRAGLPMVAEHAGEPRVA